MATYFVASGGSNTAPYDTWANAATSLDTALAAATTDGDIVVIQYNAVPTVDQENSATTTYTLAANKMQLLAASNDGGSAYTPTPMGTTSWLGNSTAARFASIQGAVTALVYGITLRAGTGTGNGSVVGGGSDGACYEMEDCYFWASASASVSTFSIGSTSVNSRIRLKNCTYRFGNATQVVRFGGMVEHVGGSVDPAGSVPTKFMFINQFPAPVSFTGFDLSHVTTTLVSSGTPGQASVIFDRCELGTGVTVLETQSPANKSSVVAYVFDCAVGDVHGFHGYYDAFGKVESDTGIFFTAGPATQSWKITTTANCSFATPFVTPPIFKYNDALSAITPYLEILRDGSTTAYDNDEVWAEFMAKVTTGSTLASFYSDRMALGGTPAAQANGVGLGSWTGESGTAWSGKIDSGGALTPAEVGDLSAQVCVGLPSATVYVDPSIRS